MSSIEIKGSAFNLTIIQIVSSSKSEIARDLERWISKAPRFFRGAPVVLQPADDCQFSIDDLSFILSEVRRHELIPVGVSTSKTSLIAMALGCGLGVFHKNADDVYDGEVQNSKEMSSCVALSRVARHQEPKKLWANTKIVRRPIRSGQQVYAKKADLVILGSVKPGAEVIADGNIHVYGKVRGRVFAGAHGDDNALILAKDFKPEMVAIAGFYKITDDIPPDVLGKSVQVALRKEKVHFFNMEI